MTEKRKLIPVFKMPKYGELTLAYEQKKIREGFSFVVGCDEVGRGCLAGPVVAAAVVLPTASEKLQIESYKGITDSKLLTAKQREKFDGIIKENSLGLGIGVVEHTTIDEINIHNASLLAMRRAVEELYLPFDLAQGERNMIIALDGKFLIPEFNMKQEAVVDGDAKILSIAAASIVAKVCRDNLMNELGASYPEYNFARHKGYATATHRESIKKYGLSPIHRISFCKNYL